MMRRAVQCGCFVIMVATGSFAVAQRTGGGGQPGGGGGAGPSPEERQRAINSRQWAEDIEKMRAQAPPPKLPTIRFPTENEKLLGRLRWAEDPKKELAQYLDKLWKGAKDAPARKVALDGFWRDAEKPKWARAAIEDYYRKHADWTELRTAPDPVELAKPAAATGAAPALTGAPSPAAPSPAAPSPAAPSPAAPSSASPKPAAAAG